MSALGSAPVPETPTPPVKIPRFTLNAFFTAPKPCEDALLDLGNAYNKLADQVEEAWAEREDAESETQQMRELIAEFVGEARRRFGIA